jgi:nucleotide-binding universal stress UspA family protein
MFERILVAIDASTVTDQVVDQAIAMAQATHAHLILLHVLSPFDQAYPSPVFPSIDAVYPSMHGEAVKAYMHHWQTYEQEGLALLRSRLDQARQAGVGAEINQSIGNPGRIICEMAHTSQADLIMIGRRGLAGLSEFLLGSVSNYVLHHAPCSVLTVQATQLIQPPPAADRTTELVPSG